MRRSAAMVVALCTLVGGLLVATAGPAGAAVSDPPNGPSDPAVVSADGRIVAFLSAADNLLDGDPSKDPNDQTDVFVLDTQTGTIRLVSDAPNHDPANGDATEVDISANGRYVAFVSGATNLLADDTNAELSDVFLFDLQTSSLTLVSRRGATGAQGNGVSWNVSISDDGSKVAFTSDASNLIASDTNKVSDTFVRDVPGAVTTLVSRASGGKLANGLSTNAGISGNAAFVAFESTASNLVSKDTNGKRDVFLKNLSTGNVIRVSVANDESQAKGISSFYDVSSTGRYVVFGSDAPNLIASDTNDLRDVFLRDKGDATTVRVSRRGATEADGVSYGAAISPDGAFVAFTTQATNLGGALEDGNGTLADVFEYEVATKALRLVSVDTAGEWADGASYDPSYGSSSLIAFSSMATDLVNGDTDGVADAFTRSWSSGRTGGVTTLRSWTAPTA
jgi:Tol biopolymer transport system component